MGGIVGEIALLAKRFLEARKHRFDGLTSGESSLASLTSEEGRKFQLCTEMAPACAASSCKGSRPRRMLHIANEFAASRSKRLVAPTAHVSVVSRRWFSVRDDA